MNPGLNRDGLRISRRRRPPLALAALLAAVGLAACSATDYGDQDAEAVASVDATADLSGGGDVVSDGALGSVDAGALDAGALDVGTDSEASTDTASQTDTEDATDGAADSSFSDAVPASTTFKIPPGVTTVDLGTHPHASGVKRVGPLTVTVPKGAIAMALSFEGTLGVTYGVDALEAPDGVTLVNAGWVNNLQNVGGQMCVTCKLRVTTMSSANAALIPNAPSVKLLAGVYTFYVLARKRVQKNQFQPPIITYPAGAVHVTAAIKYAVKGAETSGGLPANGTLDLNLYFTGSSGLTAKTAPTHAGLQQWLATMKTTYQQVGLAIGPTSYHDIDAGLQVVEGAFGPDKGDFEEIAALTAKSPWGVNMVFVREFAMPIGSPGVVLGMSGGAPGPVGVQGTGRSAVIIATAAKIPGGATPNLGLVMAHELGHYLGLFHSSEANFGGFQPAIHDPLPDTPANDTSNLMYYSAATGATNLSTQQGTVMRTNPWVRHGGQL